MIDIEKVKLESDLLAIIRHDTNLGDKPAAQTEGGEYKGPCPFCGGKNRFSVQPFRKPYPRFYCRQCTPQGGSVIDYIAKRDNLDPENGVDLAEICRRAIGGNLPQNNSTKQNRHDYIKPAYSSPAEEWQKSAEKIINSCQDRLWNDPQALKALNWLKERGLTEKTIKEFRLGYSPGYTEGGLFVARGITIPGIVKNKIWYIKIRKAVRPGEQKYTMVKGSRPAAIYNADWLIGSDIALFCEGEFDCMIAHQELNDVIPCVTLGGVTSTPDLATWGAYIIPLKKIISCYDNDDAGSDGAKRLAELAGDRVANIKIPDGKDINDLYLSGSDLFDWLKPGIKEFISEGESGRIRP